MSEQEQETRTSGGLVRAGELIGRAEGATSEGELEVIEGLAEGRVTVMGAVDERRDELAAAEEHDKVGGERVVSEQAAAAAAADEKAATTVEERDAGAVSEAEAAAAGEEEGLVTVVSLLEDESAVALFEQDGRHPEGEVYVTGEKGEVVAYRTAGVVKAIGEGRIEEVGAEPGVETVDEREAREREERAASTTLKQD